LKSWLRGFSSLPFNASAPQGEGCTGLQDCNEEATSAHSTSEVLEHLPWRNDTYLLLLDRGVRDFSVALNGTLTSELKTPGGSLVLIDAVRRSAGSTAFR
jgi:hypothetical protein